MLRCMTRKREPKAPRTYVVGIDVGTYSVGMSALEVDADGKPLSILSAVSHIHDAGVLEHKTATTRLAAGGVARRTRRLRRRRVKRLTELDRTLGGWGWGEPSVSNDPYAPWRARARLASEFVSDEVERHELLTTALRHMARHRGWRNPYVRVASLYNDVEPSKFFTDYRERVEKRLGRDFPDSVTVAELAVAAIDFNNRVPLRMGKTEMQHAEREFSYLGGKLMQSDNANEIHTYARIQGFEPELTRKIIDGVFAAESPRGSWVTKIGKDPLDPNNPRASKATVSFQRFRIVSVLANLRVQEGESGRPLTLEERHNAFNFLINFLINLPIKAEPTWSDVAKALGLTRSALSGTAALTDDLEERLPLRPPVNATERAIHEANRKLAGLRDWWVRADTRAQDALVVLLTDGLRDESSPAGVSAWELLNELDEEALTALESIDFQSGRASYSLGTLRKLTEHMLSTEDDLHAARKAVFGVDDSWVPPSEPINAPIGNPAVDRVTKIVGRWLSAAESEWGAPQRVTIEHVREAFKSMSAIRERETEASRRFQANTKSRLALQSGDKDGTRVRNSDVRRYDALQRQKGQCAYCGDTVTFHTSEMDHIVPRRGPGSTNTRTNLVAVCVPCNRSKGSIPFAVWAEKSPRAEISVEEAVARTKHWTKDAGLSAKSWAIFKKEVQDRLTRTSDDPEIDARSMESVAWMANELRDRIASEFRESGVKVSVYQGALTAGARQAAGIADKIPFVGGGDKTRLDRRHHAVDAAVVALLDESVARTLAERNNMRTAQFVARRQERDWRDHVGHGPTAQQRFATWREHMAKLAELFTQAFADDTVVVMENLRLRLGNGRVHEDTVNPMVRRPVSGALTRDEIDAASTPALWTALTRDPDFDEKDGLPENPSRQLRLHRDRLGPNDLIEFFDKPRAALAVRGGWAQLGDSIHHARIYRWEERGKTKYGMLRVFAADLARHRGEDLFAVEPSPSWISMRTAHPSIGRADLSQKEYVGWLVAGDEVRIEMKSLLAGHVGRATTALGLGDTQDWTISGFMSETQLSFVPSKLSAEGLAKFLENNEPAREAEASLNYVFKRWVVAVDTLFTKGVVSVIRRDALGRPRHESRSGLPVSWNVE